ncbi:MAG TPA: helix-hairpin-helix domain-containing protein, partial [Planctomycetota bacterium]|nr:helix-hairpin-helix domain-containing protein [Planctomycetota bacterium]
MQNPDIARIFGEVADLLEIQGENPFRVRAYRNAARTIGDTPDPLADRVREGAVLPELSGIGADLAEKISTIVKKGSLPLHSQLVKKLSP